MIKQAHKNQFLLVDLSKQNNKTKQIGISVTDKSIIIEFPRNFVQTFANIIIRKPNKKISNLWYFE